MITGMIDVEFTLLFSNAICQSFQHSSGVTGLLLTGYGSNLSKYLTGFQYHKHTSNIMVEPIDLGNGFRIIHGLLVMEAICQNI